METEEEVNLEAFNIPLEEWIVQERTQRDVSRQFHKSLSAYADEEDTDEDVDKDDEDYGGNDNDGYNSANDDDWKHRQHFRCYHLKVPIRSLCMSAAAAICDPPTSTPWSYFTCT